MQDTETQGPEPLVIDPEAAKDQFKDIRPLCSSQEEFDDITLKLTLLGAIVGQVNEIFCGSLYPEGEGTLKTSAIKSIAAVQRDIPEVFIKNSLEVGALMDIPDLPILASWVENTHKELAEQVYSEGFCSTVIYPALEAITANIIQFDIDSREEEAAASSEKK